MIKYTNEFCIVNYSNGVFLNGQNRMKESLLSCGYTGDFLFFSDPDNIFFPSHDESPWGFKPLAIKKAVEKGYKYILWLDSSIICIRNPERIFSKILNDGFYFLTSRYDSLGEWCSDYALLHFGIEREESFSIDELNASVIGFNSTNELARTVLDTWCSCALAGNTFRGLPKEYALSETFNNTHKQCSSDNRVKGHRHDQTVLSYIVWKNHCKTSYKEVKNVQSFDAGGHSVYSKAIPFFACLVQNRDIKTREYLKTYSKWGNFRGIKKIIFIILSFIASVKEFLIDDR